MYSLTEHMLARVARYLPARLVRRVDRWVSRRALKQ